MSTVHELVKGRLALVREDLDEVIGHLSDKLLPWAPTTGMRTVGGQLIEIAATEVQVLTWMRESRQITFQEAENFAGREATLDGLRAVLHDTRAQTLSYFDSLSESDLEKPVPFPDRWFESLRLPFAPRSEAFRSIAQHEWYHVGQLVSYLWSRGDDPYKW